jgi:hypothetical protein
MPEWTFTLIVDRPVGDRDDQIFETLDGYAFSVGEENGAWVVECAGEYPRYRDLLLGCIATLSLDLGIETLAVQDEGDEVTLQEIADRIGKSREAVAKYSRGELKSATEPFPPPVRDTRWGAPWSWWDVTTWLLHNIDWSAADDEVHRVIVGVNALLRARREFPDLEWVKVLPRLGGVAA